MEEKRKWDMDRLTNGEYAALRHAAESAEFDASAWRAFYKLDFQGEKGANERFTALCMSCLWRKTDHPAVLPMEECLRRICLEKGEDGNSFARRVDALLETRWSPDGYFQGKLLNLVKIIRSDGRFKPDFEKLADDLYRWNYDSRSVQRRWLNVIYQNKKNANDNEEENKNDA